MEGHATEQIDHLNAIRSVFTPLLELKALKILEVDFKCASEVDDEWIAEASIGWPFLEILQLGGDESAPRVTLKGLIPLIRRCTHLGSIQMSMHLKPFNVGLLKPGDRNMRIRELHVSTCTISKPIRVFRRLVLMFPQLLMVSAHATSTPGEEKDWARLESLFNEDVDDDEGGDEDEDEE
ncbi:hypothetical protein H0H81_010348 [Sphagnurus paluster]|uniref:Uncharacterized protein n=1 Tax=Sphagnurus paluster TaxID=117069 RepID=A0A9P7K495_9AGAR|nr:hypothetical protein H0H81_010348 [Sphagnurus paluster]